MSLQRLSKVPKRAQPHRLSNKSRSHSCASHAQPHPHSLTSTTSQQDHVKAVDAQTGNDPEERISNTNDPRNSHQPEESLPNEVIAPICSE
ncbi:hypothetical protein AVEN_158810-1 [Araneus ventricosus]|uniref:Uncharacterized protein n=1 Tax=Araneus ventricosus TaxID=182803 RepID=A0A4Y2HU65_ARAVE|nr:hypothetical protein AVEN_158810-1 [Araneus ventricosus]